MNKEELFTKALGIESPWFVKRLEFNESLQRLELWVEFTKGSTFPSPDPSVPGAFKAYDTVPKTWRHWDFFQHECLIHCRTPRLDLGGGRVRLVTPPWAGRAPGFTLLFEARCIELCRQMPVASAARFIKVSNGRLWRMVNLYADGARQVADMSTVDAVGVDETSMRKGHNYVSLFVDLKERRTLFVAEGRAEPVVARFAEDLAAHGGDAGAVRAVSCDMSPAFISGVAKHLPKAEVTFDKFHILKIINEGVDKVRRAEAAEQPILAKARWAVLKNRENLTDGQRKKLAELQMSKLNLRTMKAMRMRENFQAVYQADTEAEFVQLLKKWRKWVLRSGLAPMVAAAKTIERHWDGVVSWKRSQINNGILEGLNSLVQAAKAKARGYRTFRNFQTIIYLLTAKLDFFPLNPYFKILDSRPTHSLW